jgi:hypothetical protein
VKSISYQQLVEDVVMTDIPVSEFTKGLLAVLKEAFESVEGYFLDRGTSLFETLAEIDAAQASIPVGGKCATLAAQVAHVNFYLEVLERYLETGQNERVDWGEIWRTVREVTPEEWAASQERLKQSYRRISGHIEQYAGWNAADEVAGAVGLVAHTAYHLGEIRQALCTLKK